MKLVYLLVIVHTMIWQTTGKKRIADKPCTPMATNSSVVCVCTPTYCDTVTRETPESGIYYTYVSTKAGRRFHKTKFHFKSSIKVLQNNAILELDPDKRYQTIVGFGGAVTDSAGINWKNLSDPQLMQNLIESYCGNTGIEYNMLRVPIGGTDFSTQPYTYDVTVHNGTLTNFSLASEDYIYKIPMIKACMAASHSPINIVASSWTAPPSWKTNKNFTGYGRLMKKYFQPYADYHYKFMEEYTNQDIHIWGITTSNEPIDGSFDFAPINDMAWTIPYLGEWIIENLGPTVKKSTFRNVKIMSGDDQRFTIPLLWDVLVSEYPKTLQYLDGFAVHFYFDKIVPAAIMPKSMKGYPDKFILATEASSGAMQTDFPKVDLGSWQRAEDYMIDIIEDLSNDVIGWIDWNMCLNKEGGPNWAKNFVDSPIIVNPDKQEFYKQPMFYAIGHFSKFVPRGSERINVIVHGATKLKYIAFCTPHNTVIIILYNGCDRTEVIVIRLEDQEALIHVDNKSFNTVEMAYDCNY